MKWFDKVMTRVTLSASYVRLVYSFCKTDCQYLNMDS
jgi:hypothetical protein